MKNKIQAVFMSSILVFSGFVHADGTSQQGQLVWYKSQSENSSPTRYPVLLENRVSLREGDLVTLGSVIPPDENKQRSHSRVSRFFDSRGELSLQKMKELVRERATDYEQHYERQALVEIDRSMTSIQRELDAARQQLTSGVKSLSIRGDEYGGAGGSDGGSYEVPLTAKERRDLKLKIDDLGDQMKELQEKNSPRKIEAWAKATAKAEISDYFIVADVENYPKIYKTYVIAGADDLSNDKLTVATLQSIIQKQTYIEYGTNTPRSTLIFSLDVVPTRPASGQAAGINSKSAARPRSPSIGRSAAIGGGLLGVAGLVGVVYHFNRAQNSVPEDRVNSEVDLRDRTNPSHSEEGAGKETHGQGQR